MLVLDLVVVHRAREHVISLREAAIESAVWITVGLSFALFVLWWHGGQAAGEYITGYLIEKSLSVDNVFVWAVILSYFRVRAEDQFRVLFWGVFGALLLRAIFIFAGVALLDRFEWVLYLFGAFLLYTAWKISRHTEQEVHPDQNPVVRLVRRVAPRVSAFAIVLIVVETTDLLFAVDSVPAILAVSRQAFIVFSSNAFAILGLRSLYFCLAGMKDRFRYLDTGLAIILAFVGIKMLTSKLVHLPTWLSLAVIAVTLTVTVIASLREDATPTG